MWTPRRIGLLLAGCLVFGAAFLGYSHALGWLDGLPQIPAAYLKRAVGDVMPPQKGTSPTELLLSRAFGPDCLEKNYTRYATQLHFLNGDSSIVLAAGRFPGATGQTRITLVPFSLAVFGKPKPVYAPDEVQEISTFHSDKAVLEFDRPINTPQDMSKAKLLRMELVSDPDDPLPDLPDPRRGHVHVATNQRSADPNKALLMKTVGPVFYRDPKAVPNAQGPDIWTDAAIEVVDRSGLPRPPGGPAPQTAPARGDELRDADAVAEVLSGRRLPPPTVTAVGMKLYMEGDKSGKPAADEKKAGGMSGLRRIELTEKVLIHLWTDAKTSFVGTPSPGAGGPAAESPAATAAVVGGLFDGVAAVRGSDKALLQIETLGPFSYDTAKSLARFEVIAQANPDVPNDVQVTRITAKGGQHKLFSQVLEIEFNGPPTGGPAPQPAAKAAPAAGGPSFKTLHAWTVTPNRFLTVTAEPEPPSEANPQPGGDALQAYGQDLVYDQPVGRTVLRGSPLYAVRDRSLLTAGTPQTPAALVIDQGADKKMAMTVNGPGDIKMFDPAANDTSLRAEWKTSLVHQKEGPAGKEVDLMTFTGGAVFEDKKADYWLRGKTLRLWLGAVADRPKGGGNSPLPQRVQAVDDVTAHSAEFDILRADHMNALFRDAPPTFRPVAAAPLAPAAPGTPPVAGGPAPVAPAPEPPPEPVVKQKPPLKLQARVIDTFVLRVPRPGGKPAAPGPDGRPGGAGVRYELESARCDGQVVVHQDPTEPDKPRGVDILGQKLVLIQHRFFDPAANAVTTGSEMIVGGADENTPGEVHYEGMSILGPRVFIDQVHNRASVEGRGALQMPSGSDINGGELKQPENMVVHWRDGMTFSGAKKTAEFAGKVSAVQGDSWVRCHTMTVVFDRPVYFNNFRKPADTPAAGKSGSAKIQNVYCYPAPEDGQADPWEANVWYYEVVRDPATGNIVKTQRVEAKELELRGHDKGTERHNDVLAQGRGETRMWQPGQKDVAAGPAPAAPAPGGPPKADETEMKLTIVTYRGRMTVQDRKVYQEAVFTDSVEVLHIPSPDPNAEFKPHQLPPGSVKLKCEKTLTASSHKQRVGPPRQGMTAEGNAFIQTDEYDGWGEVIEYDGQTVILRGSKTGPAVIKGRFGRGNDTSGQEIHLNRRTNQVEVKNAYGGSIRQSGPGR